MGREDLQRPLKKTLSQHFQEKKNKQKKLLDLIFFTFLEVTKKPSDLPKVTWLFTEDKIQM